MGRFIIKKKQEIGLSPDDLYFRGEQKADSITLRLIDFDATQQEESIVERISEVIAYQDKPTVTWFNIDGLHDRTLMQEIADKFEFDNLVLAQVLDTQARPKITEYDNCIAVSIKVIKYDEKIDEISVENLSLILTDSLLISFQEQRGDIFEPVRERIRHQKKRIRHSGTDYLLFALLDIVVDNYIFIISSLGENIEALEDKLLTNPNKETIDEINGFKKELNFLRKNINPAKEMILGLTKIESEFINEENEVHFKELLDNINQAVETTDSYREILSDQLNIYHTTISTKLNDIMKFLTVFSVIFIPLTFIAGIYGTNFEYVPELNYHYSYFIMWGLMIVVVIGMLIYFRKRKWLE